MQKGRSCKKKELHVNKNTTLQILFKENMKILVKTLNVSIYPKTSYNELNDQLIVKNQKPTPKLQTHSELITLKTLWTDCTTILYKYLFLGILNDFNLTIFVVSHSTWETFFFHKLLSPNRIFFISRNYATKSFQSVGETKVPNRGYLNI